MDAGSTALSKCVEDVVEVGSRFVKQSRSVMIPRG
jgi:hypothetical protein